MFRFFFFFTATHTITKHDTIQCITGFIEDFVFKKRCPTDKWSRAVAHFSRSEKFLFCLSFLFSLSCCCLLYSVSRCVLFAALAHSFAGR
jgi:hypothetical protein